MALTATDLFNDATTREIGGIGPDQVNLIVADLIGVQQQLSAASPQINNLTDLHAHIIVNQLTEEIASVENANSPTGTLILGTDLDSSSGAPSTTSTATSSTSPRVTRASRRCSIRRRFRP